ncbi:MAG: preprotein translocase subunit SecG [Planctomyces sp.]|nr:preprotein translocase subunit SecG [Planctomyces sp.]
MIYFLITLLILIGLFLSLVILIQKGRGGGLAGAFGGAGGQSAFGTKAGDVFTKITVVVATIWIVLAAVAGIIITGGAGNLGDQFKSEEASVAAPGDGEAAAADSAEEEVEQNDFTSELSVPSAGADAGSVPEESTTEESAAEEPAAEESAGEEPAAEEPAAEEATPAEPTEEPAADSETNPNE